MSYVKTEIDGIKKRYSKRQNDWIYYGSFWYSFDKNSKTVRLGGKSEGITSPKKALVKLNKIAEKANNRNDLYLKEKEDKERAKFTGKLTLNVLAEKYFEDRYIMVEKKFEDRYKDRIRDKDGEVEVFKNATYKEKRQSVRTEEKRYQNHVGRKPIGKMRISQIKISDIENWLETLDGVIAEKTKFNVFSLVRAIWNKSIKQRYINIDNPFNGSYFNTIKNPHNIRDRVLDKKEIDKLLEELQKEKDYNAYYCTRLALMTGGRATTILNIKCKDVNLVQKNIRLYNLKTGGKYTIPISDQNVEFLQEVISKHEYEPDDYIIRPIRDGFRKNSPMREIPKTFFYVVNRLFNEHLDLSNNEDRNNDVVNFHTLRHTFATNLVNRDADITIIKEFLNHADIKTSIRYAKAKESKMRQFIE